MSGIKKQLKKTGPGQKGINFVGVAVVYFCHDGKGGVIMQRRGQNCRDEKGRWDIGGGGVEFGVPIEKICATKFWKSTRLEFCLSNFWVFAMFIE